MPEMWEPRKRTLQCLKGQARKNFMPKTVRGLSSMGQFSITVTSPISHCTLPLSVSHGGSSNLEVLPSLYILHLRATEATAGGRGVEKKSRLGKKRIHV